MSNSDVLKEWGKGNKWLTKPHPKMLGKEGLVIPSQALAKGDSHLSRQQRNWLYTNQYLSEWLKVMFAEFRTMEDRGKLKEFLTEWINANL